MHETKFLQEVETFKLYTLQYYEKLCRKIGEFPKNFNPLLHFHSKEQIFFVHFSWPQKPLYVVACLRCRLSQPEKIVASPALIS